jgi:hypothetical protein
MTRSHCAALIPDKLTNATFEEWAAYHSKGRPVILTDASRDWVRYWATVPGLLRTRCLRPVPDQRTPFGNETLPEQQIKGWDCDKFQTEICSAAQVKYTGDLGGFYGSCMKKLGGRRGPDSEVKDSSFRVYITGSSSFSAQSRARAGRPASLLRVIAVQPVPPLMQQSRRLHRLTPALHPHQHPTDRRLA